MRIPTSLRLLICTLALSALLGCGNGRIPIAGSVTLDGQPLEHGSIEFQPEPGTPGPTAGGEIVNGKFAIPAAGGPLAGKFTIRIKSTGLTGRKIFDPRNNAMVDEFAQRLPAKYNSQSQIRAEVTSAGSNRFEFAVTSQ